MSDEDVLDSLKRLEQMVGALNQRLSFVQRDVDGIKNQLILNGESAVKLKNGIKVNVPNQLEDVIQRTIVMNKDFYELEILKFLDQFIPHNAVILDIGANIGNHTLYWLSHKTSSFVYAFEPIAETFNLLKSNIELNEFDARVSLFEVGLSNVVGSGAIVKFDSGNRGATVIGHEDTGDLKLVTLDSLSIEQKIDFVKIDVEGFEANVLKGGNKLLKRDKPPIFIEVFPNEYDRVSRILEVLEYQLAQKLPGDNYLWIWTGT